MSEVAYIHMHMHLALSCFLCVHTLPAVLHRLMYTFTWSLPHWPDCLIVSDRVFVSSVVGDALLEFEAAASGESKVTALLACIPHCCTFLNLEQPSSSTSRLPS